MTSLLGAEWQQRLELHKQLAATPDFAAGLDWLAAHPVPFPLAISTLRKH